MKNGLRDGEAFDRLVEEHYDDVLAYCRRHAPSYDDAPDVAQEAFLRFVRSGRSPREGKPLAYLFTIARNLCIDAYRKQRAQTVPLDTYADAPEMADPHDALGDVELACALERLDPDLREVLELRYDQGLTVTEAARVLGISRFAATRRLKRALAALEQLLSPHAEGDAYESAR